MHKLNGQVETGIFRNGWNEKDRKVDVGKKGKSTTKKNKVKKEP